MMVKKIFYAKMFVKSFKRLLQHIQALAIKKEQLFKENPFHPSLRLHQLHGQFLGTMSLSLNKRYRIIFEHLGNGEFLFLSIGKHEMYRKKK